MLWYDGLNLYLLNNIIMKKLLSAYIIINLLLYWLFAWIMSYICDSKKEIISQESTKAYSKETYIWIWLLFPIAIYMLDNSSKECESKSE